MVLDVAAGILLAALVTGVIGVLIYGANEAHAEGRSIAPLGCSAGIVTLAALAFIAWRVFR